MNVLIFSLIFCLAFGCANVKHQSLKWDGNSSSKKIKLSTSDIKSDVDLLIYALKKAYIGVDYIDKKIFDSFLKDLLKLHDIDYVDNVEFCHKLASQFHKLPDGHFKIWFPNHLCYLSPENSASVGNNLAISNVEIKPFFFKEISNENIAILAISHFPNFESDLWIGYKEAIEKSKIYNKLIIDLRGNGGGDSRSGLFLARELLNSSIKHNRKKIIRKNTVESWVIYRNNILRDKIWFDLQGDDTKHLDLMIGEIDKKIDGINFFSSPHLVSTYEIPKIDLLGYKGEIYILIDKFCGSSCEHTLEALKFHPNARSVGKNTAGAIHFGQMGLIRLPKSGVYLNLATQYFELFSNGFYEKIGYQPDYIVPDGEDALVYILKKLDSHSM